MSDKRTHQEVAAEALELAETSQSESVPLPTERVLSLALEFIVAASAALDGKTDKKKA